MATKILVRRGVIADLDQETLDEGELGFTTDTLGLYVGSDTATEGYVKINKTDNIEYDGNALTSATDTDNLKEAIQNIDVALKTEQDNVDTLQTDVTNITNGTTNITYDPTASGLTATNIKAAIDEIDGNIDAIPSQREWSLVVEINSNSNSITLNQSSLGEAVNSLSYDYKVVLLAQTDSTDTSGEFSIRLDNDSTSGRHSSVRHMTTMGSSGPVESVSGSDGSAGTLIGTGLTLGTGSGTQGTQTLLQAEFIVSAGLSFSANESFNIDVHPYIVEGSGSVVAVESSTQGSSVVSYTRLSNFTGGYAKTTSHDGSRNLTSIVLSNLPDAGLLDDVKVRVYKRER